MPVFTERMPAGFPGNISRQADAQVEPTVAASAIAFGGPVQLDAAGKIVAATVEAKGVYGFLARPFPFQARALADNALGGGGIEAGQVGDVMRSGYMSVKMSAAETSTPVKGTPVKVVFTATGSFVVGDIAMSQGVAVPGCIFMGAPDASGNVEIAFNI